MIRFILTVCLFVSTNALAGYFQSPVNEVVIKNYSVKLENGAETGLSDLIKATKNLILVPAYFSCNSTCPLLAENLRDSISSAKVNTATDVMFMSFNSSDNARTMKMFREHHRLPANWILAVANRESEAKDILDQFGYQFQKTTNGFDHPNSAFVFSRLKKLWTGIIVGVDSTPEDIQKAIGDANYADLNGPTQKIFQYLSKPEYLIVFGFFGVVLPLLLIIFVLFRKNKKLVKVNLA